MSNSIAQSSAAFTPERPDSERRLLLSIRSIKYFLFWLNVWQDSMIDGSPLQIHEYTGSLAGVRPIEVLMVALLIVVLIERTITRDYTVKRSYFWAPLILMTAAPCSERIYRQLVTDSTHFASGDVRRNGATPRT